MSPLTYDIFKAYNDCSVIIDGVDRYVDIKATINDLTGAVYLYARNPLYEPQEPLLISDSMLQMMEKTMSPNASYWGLEPFKILHISRCEILP